MRVVLCLLGVLVVTCVYAAPAEYVCRAAAAPPVIDGVLDDAAWTVASPPPAFTELGVGGGTAKNSTQVRLLRDGRALYVAVQAQTAPGVLPNAQVRERDSRHWGDDCLEVMLAPGFGTTDHWHFILSAAGARWDYHNGAGLDPDQAVAWNPEWTAVTKTAPGGWTAEITIPWQSLGVAAPPRGHVWRAKLAAVAKSFPHSTWPRNESQAFGNPDAWGYLIFTDPNLATNADFEQGPPAQGQPEGYSYAYHATEGQGVCSITDEDHVSGKFAGKLEKTDDKDWFPVFYTRELSVQGGSTYEIAAMVKCDRQYVMRYNLSGEGGGKRSLTMPATKGWERARQEVVVPDGPPRTMTVGFQLIRTKGVILLDDLLVRRLNDITAVVSAVKTPHNYHHLEELAARTAFKPYSLLLGSDGSYQSDRVIYQDSSTGTETWLLSRSPGGSTRHIYMEMSPWNADGSLLCFTTSQVGGGTMLMDPGTGVWRKLPYYASAYIWDRRQPERIYFRSYRGHDKTDLWDLAIGDVKQGTFERVKRFDGDLSLWPMSTDAEKLLVQEHFRPEGGKPYSRLWLMDRDGKTGQMLDPKGETHQTWFMKLPDYSVEFEWEGQEPPGQYVISTDGKVRKLFDQTTGHRAHSPNGEWIAVMSGCAIRNSRTGELKVISSESSDHQTWETDDNWYATSSGRFMRRVVAFGSPTTQLIGAHNTALKHSTYWTEAHPEMSHDGTKLGYASSMMGDIEFYWMVMGTPSPPQRLTARREGNNLALSWQPGRYHKETKGYLVYCSPRSGEAGKLLTPEPVSGTTAQVPYADGFYRVTALEHTGLESLPSAEARVGTNAPLNLYVEAESGKYEAPAVEEFDAQAAGLFAVTLGSLRASGPLALACAVPQAGTYTLWVRARGDGELQSDAGTVKSAGKDWQWLRFDKPLTLKAGAQTLSLTPGAASLCVDRVVLAGDPAYRPVGLGGADEAAPSAPGGLQAQPADSYAVRLTWQAVGDLDVHHYNVYCGATADFAVGQERLIGSPAATAFVDWGLQAGRGYHYRVTAVDRAGNESAPSAVASTATLPLAQRLFVSLDRKWDTTAQQSVSLPFTLPADGEFVVWGKVQSLDGAPKATVALALDGKPLDKQGLPFGYISIGHGGPVLNTTLWHCLRPGRAKADDPLTYHAAAGEHTLTLTAEASAKVSYDGFVITNDRGFVPEGTVNFMIPAAQ